MVLKTSVTTAEFARTENELNSTVKLNSVDYGINSKESESSTSTAPEGGVKQNIALAEVEKKVTSEVPTTNVIVGTIHGDKIGGSPHSEHSMEPDVLANGNESPLSARNDKLDEQNPGE